MFSNQRIAAIAMVAVMVLTGGCAGFGTDGPVDEGDGEADADEAGTDDLEEADGDADEDQDQDDQPGGGEGAVDGSTDDGSDGSADSDDTPSDSDSASDTGSDTSEDTKSESGTNGTRDDTDPGDDGDGDASDGDRDEAGDDGDDTDDGDPGNDEAPYGTLTVTVEDSDGEPVEGVKAVGIGPGGEIYSSATDENGRVTVDLGDGEYTWYVTTDGTEYNESSEEEITMDGNDESITLTVQADDDGDEDETHTLQVGIVDATATGNVAGTVTVNGETKESTPDDPAEFELEDGTYTVTGGYIDGWHVYDKEVVIDGKDVETTLHAVPIRALTVDAGEPGVDVTIERERTQDDGETMTVTTGDDGVATVDTLPGPHTISADGYETREFTVPADFDPDPVALEPADGGESETHTLTVTIVDQTAAGPMQGTATVNDETKTVDGDNGAQFELEDGTYIVTGEAANEGWHVGSEEVTIDGENEDVSLPANPIRTITVDTDEAGVDVTLADDEGDEVETKTTGDDGRVEFDALPGNYSLHAAGYESADVTVPADQDPETVEMSPATVTHTLTINNAGTSTVEIEREAQPGGDDGELITAEPDENGVVEVDVKEGTYHVRTDDRNDTMVGIHVDEDTEITLQDPNPDSITIEVVDADTGEGIEGAEISGVCDMWYSSGDDYITGTTGPDGITEAEPGLSPTNCDANINAEDYEEEVVQLSVPEDDGMTIELQPEEPQPPGDGGMMNVVTSITIFMHRSISNRHP